MGATQTGMPKARKSYRSTKETKGPTKKRGYDAKKNSASSARVEKARQVGTKGFLDGAIRRLRFLVRYLSDAYVE